VSAELADTESLEVVWTDKVEGQFDDLFLLQDQLCERIVQTIAPHILDAELRRVRRKRSENLDAYDYMLRGRDLLYRLDKQQFDEARNMFERAMYLDDNYAAPHAYTALWHSININQGWSSDARSDLAAVDRHASAALERDQFDVAALSLSGHLRALLFRDFEGAFALLERAIAACPNSAFAWGRSSPVFSYVGEGEEARRRAEQALRLSPLDPQLFFTHCALGLAAYTEGRYDTAVSWARRAFAENPKYTANLRFLTASLAAAGLIEEAKRSGATLLSLEPKFSVDKFCQGYAYKDAARRDLLKEHLIRAGLPE
jgi:tetratricopeptide (TPR) repeat protein